MRSFAENRRRKNRIRAIVCAVAVAVLAGAGAIFGPKLYSQHFDPYRNWPSAGTVYAQGEFRPNVLVVVTCDDNKPVIKDYPTGSGNKEEWKQYSLSMRVRLYTAYEPRTVEGCLVYWDPMSRFLTLEFTPIVLGEDGLWHNDEWEQPYARNPPTVQEVAVRERGIAVFMLTISTLDPGELVLNGPNGVPAPSRNLIES